MRYVQPKPNVVLQHQPVRYVQQAPLKRFVQNQPQLVHQPQILHANPAIKYYGHSQPIVPGKLIQDPAVIVIDRNRALGKPSSDSEIKEYLAYLDRTYFHKKQGGYNYPDESVLKNPVNKGSAPVNLKESMAIKNKPLLKPALEQATLLPADKLTGFKWTRAEPEGTYLGYTQGFKYKDDNELVELFMGKRKFEIKEDGKIKEVKVPEGKQLSQAEASYIIRKNILLDLPDID